MEGDYMIYYGWTEKTNNKLLTIGNYYTIKDNTGNEIEATLTSFNYADFAKFGVRSCNFVKRKLAKKQVKGCHYKTEDILRDVPIVNIIEEIANIARTEKVEKFFT